MGGVELRVMIRVHFFQAGDSSTQELCQGGKLKLNNCVSVTFIHELKGSWDGAGSEGPFTQLMQGSEKLHATK